MTAILHDLRHAVRELSKKAGSTAIVVVALALGIAVNAAVFSLVDTVLFKPLPGKNPQRLVELSGGKQRGAIEFDGTAYPTYKQYHDELKGFVDLAAYHNFPVYFSAGSGDAKQIFSAFVAGDFFRILGLTAERGRLISLQDDGVSGSNPVVVLSDQLWRRLGAQNLLGSTVRLNSHPYTVIGIAPPSLRDFDRVPELWVPLSMATQVFPMLESQFDRMTNPMVRVLGRLADNVSLPQAQSKIEAVDSALGSGQTIHLFEGMEGEKTVAAPSSSSKEPGDYIDWQRPWGTFKPAEKQLAPDEIHLSWLLLGAASLVLLIACVDVAGLLLARSAQRQKETAIRLALGASRLQLLRQRFTEGIVLAIAGAGVGILLAFWISRLLLASAPTSITLVSATCSSVVTLRVCGFISAISLLVAIGLSVLTTWREAKPALLDSLKSERPVVRSGLARGIPIQAILVAFQIALSFVLLSSAGLLLRTLQNRASVNLGFNTDHLLSAWLDFSRHGYDKARGATMLRPIQEGISQVPGVEAVALRSGALLGGGQYHSDSTNSAAWDCSNLPLQIVGPGYFRTLEMPLLHGRDFSSTDGKNAAGVAIVNQAAASLCWPQKEPLHQFLPSVKTLKKPFEIIGVVANMKFVADNEAPAPLLFVPLSQFYEAFPFQLPLGIVVRTAVEPHSLVPAMLSALHRLDANLILNNIETADDALATEFGEERFLSNLLLAFGGLALVLATAGLYGVLSYLTSRRTREFGIRLALGARRSDIMSLVLMQGGSLILGSVIVGAFAAAASARLIRNLLFEVAGTDPLTYTVMAVFVLVADLVACSLPARRATKVDPMVALRYE